MSVYSPTTKIILLCLQQYSLCIHIIANLFPRFRWVHNWFTNHVISTERGVGLFKNSTSSFYFPSFALSQCGTSRVCDTVRRRKRVFSKGDDDGSSRRMLKICRNRSSVGWRRQNMTKRVELLAATAIPSFPNPLVSPSSSSITFLLRTRRHQAVIVDVGRRRGPPAAPWLSSLPDIYESQDSRTT